QPAATGVASRPRACRSGVATGRPALRGPPPYTRAGCRPATLSRIFNICRTPMIEAIGGIGFGLFGLAVLIGIVWLFSNNRRAIDWRLVGTGVLLQIAFAAVVRLVPGGGQVFDPMSHGFVRVLVFVHSGFMFIIGMLDARIA